MLAKLYFLAKQATLDSDAPGLHAKLQIQNQAHHDLFAAWKGCWKAHDSHGESPLNFTLNILAAMEERIPRTGYFFGKENFSADGRAGRNIEMEGILGKPLSLLGRAKGGDVKA